MKKFTFENFLDQRRPVIHVFLITISLVITFLIIIIKADYEAILSYIWMFVILLIQIELFIFLGVRIFRDFNPVSTPGMITRLILSRFLLFNIACLISSFILILSARYIDCLIKSNDPSQVFNIFFKYDFRGWFKATAIGLFMGAIIFIYLQWQQALKGEQKLREEKLIFQNETLKNQVNPHFLFNSLNTISSLIQSDPESAEQFINNLSSVYRYILESGNKDKVSLQSELDFINVYFNLFKIRDEEKIKLDIQVENAEMYETLPASLQILLENAIKHNSATRENPLKISIYTENHLIVVKNNLQKRSSQLESTGIGLRNLAQRLRLITGKELVKEQTNSEFIIKLPLIL